MENPRPTLVIGLGGTGVHVLTHIKAILVNRYGVVPSSIELLALDADKEVLKGGAQVNGISLKDGEDFFYFGGEGNIHSGASQGE